MMQLYHEPGNSASLICNAAFVIDLMIVLTIALSALLPNTYADVVLFAIVVYKTTGFAKVISSEQHHARIFLVVPKLVTWVKQNTFVFAQVTICQIRIVAGKGFWILGLNCKPIFVKWNHRMNFLAMKWPSSFSKPAISKPAIIPT